MFKSRGMLSKQEILGAILLGYGFSIWLTFQHVIFIRATTVVCMYYSLFETKNLFTARYCPSVLTVSTGGRDFFVKKLAVFHFLLQ